MVLTKLLHLPPGKKVTSIAEVATEYEEQIRSGNRVPDNETREEFIDRKMGEQAILHMPDYDLLALGRWQFEGCQCVVNRVLNNTLDGILSRYDLVLIDNEAGIEQVGRHAHLNIDLLLLVAQPDPLFLDVCQQIMGQAKAVNQRIFTSVLVLNRVGVDIQERLPYLKDNIDGVGADLVEFLPESSDIQKNVLQNKPLVCMRSISEWVIAFNNFMHALPIVNKLVRIDNFAFSDF